jgi:hypothetical protein
LSTNLLQAPQSERILEVLVCSAFFPEQSVAKTGGLDPKLARAFWKSP